MIFFPLVATSFKPRSVKVDIPLAGYDLDSLSGYNDGRPKKKAARVRRAKTWGLSRLVREGLGFCHLSGFAAAGCNVVSLPRLRGNVTTSPGGLSDYGPASILSRRVVGLQAASAAMPPRRATPRVGRRGEGPLLSTGGRVEGSDTEEVNTVGKLWIRKSTIRTPEAPGAGETSFERGTVALTGTDNVHPRASDCVRSGNERAGIVQMPTRVGPAPFPQPHPPAGLPENRTITHCIMSTFSEEPCLSTDTVRGLRARRVGKFSIMRIVLGFQASLLHAGRMGLREGGLRAGRSQEALPSWRQLLRVNRSAKVRFWIGLIDLRCCGLTGSEQAFTF